MYLIHLDGGFSLDLLLPFFELVACRIIHCE